MFEWGSNLSEKERIQKNVTNIINISKNEVRYDMGLGVTPDYIDKPLSSASSDIITDILDTIEEREPRADISIEDLEELSENAVLEVNINA